jgi:hypothetical protein
MGLFQVGLYVGLAVLSIYLLNRGLETYKKNKAVQVIEPWLRPYLKNYTLLLLIFIILYLLIL